MSEEKRGALAETLFDIAFPGERERDPYWYEAHGHDWLAQADRFLASDWLAEVVREAKQEVVRDMESDCARAERFGNVAVHIGEVRRTLARHAGADQEEA